MRLLLTSAGFTNEKIADFFISELPKEPENCSVLLVAYAQNRKEQSYVDESKRELLDLGITKITFFNLANDKFSDSNIYDVIYVCGGNTYAILQRLRITETDKFIKTSVQQNALYVGVSAGSIIAGPNIEGAGWGSEGDKNDVALADLTGLKFTEIAVYPHFDPQQKTEVEKFKTKVIYPVIELTDDQALYIKGSKFKIIE